MNTLFGDIPDKFINKPVKMTTVLEALNVLSQLPMDLPIGRLEVISCYIDGAPASPALELHFKEMENSNDSF